MLPRKDSAGWSILYVLLTVALCLVGPANSFAERHFIYGSVHSVSGDTVVIDSVGLLPVSVGAEAEVIMDVPGGGYAVIASGKVTSIKGLKYTVKITRATGKIKIGQKARIEQDKLPSGAGRGPLDRDSGLPGPNLLEPGPPLDPRARSSLLGFDLETMEEVSKILQRRDSTTGATTRDPNQPLNWPRLFDVAMVPKANRNPGPAQTDKQGRRFIEASATGRAEQKLQVTVIVRRYESAQDAAQATAKMLPSLVEMQNKMIAASAQGTPGLAEFLRATNFVVEDLSQAGRRLVMVTLGPGRDREPRHLKSLRGFQLYDRYLITHVVNNDQYWPEDPAPLRPEQKTTWPGLLHNQTASIVNALETYGKQVADQWSGRKTAPPQQSEQTIQPRDTVETLVDAPIQSGTETLTTVAAGTRLTANKIQDTWVSVTVQRSGKAVNGWISAEHLKRVVPLEVPAPPTEPERPAPRRAVPAPPTEPDEPTPRKAEPMPRKASKASPTSGSKTAASRSAIAASSTAAAAKPAWHASPIHLETTESVLETLTDFPALQRTPPDLLARTLLASPDSRHIVHIVLEPSEFAVVIDGKEGKRFDAIDEGSLRFSTEHDRSVYVGRRGEGLFVVVDGVEHGPYDELGKGSPSFSPQTARVCFTARRAKQWFVVIDGVEETPHDQIAGPPVFGPLGQRYAYAVIDGPNRRVVVDGSEQPSCERIDVRSLRFGPEGKHVAYTASRDKKRHVVVDGVPSRPLNVILPGGEVAFDAPDRITTLGILGRDLVRMETEVIPGDGEGSEVALKSTTTKLGQLSRSLPPNSIVISPDGRHLGWVLLRPDQKWEAVVDGKRSEPFDAIRKGTLIFSSDGKRFACGVGRDGKQSVLVDDEESEPFDLALRPIFSPDGSHVAFLASRGGKRLAVVDGIAGPEYDNIEPKSLMFSRAGRVSYVARRRDADRENERIVVIDGEEGPVFDDVSLPRFGPQGKRVAYFASCGAKQTVVIDGDQGPLYDLVRRDTLVFSDDESQVAYFGIRDGKLYLFRNGKEDESRYSEVVHGSARFSPDGQFAFAAYREILPAPWYMLVIDGDEKSRHQAIQGPIVFNRAGDRLACVTRHGGLKVVRDGVPGKRYWEMAGAGVVFSPDSQRLAYLAVPQGETSFLVVDGEEGKPCFGIWEHNVMFSPDSHQVATVVDYEDDDVTAFYVRVGETEIGPYSGFDAKGMRFSDDGRRWAIRMERDDQMVLVVDGEESSMYDVIDRPVFSSDGQHVAAQVGREEKSFLWLDGQEGEAWDAFGKGSPCFAPDGRVAFSARRGQDWFVVIDGEPSPVDGSGVFLLGFSADGSRLYTMVLHDGEVRLAVDGVEQTEAYDRFSMETFRTSPQGNRYAFVATRNEKELVVLDGEDGKLYDQVWGSSLTFSPDGRRFACVARTDKKWVMVVDGVEGPPMDDVLQPAFSPNGRSLAYAARRGRDWRMVVDGVEGRIYSDIAASAQPFSPDGEHVAYWGQRNNAWRPVVDGAEGDPYDMVLPRSELVFDSSTTLHALAVRNPDALKLDLKIVPGAVTPAAVDDLVIETKDTPVVELKRGLHGPSIATSFDNRRVAYALNRDGKWTAVIDGKESKTYDKVHGPWFSPDGSQAVYIAVVGSEKFIVGGSEERRYDAVSAPIFSSNSQHMAYIARHANRYRIIVDGKEGAEYDAYGNGSPVLSPDGSRVAAFMRRGRNDWYLLVDGVESGPYQDFSLGSPTFSPDGQRVAAVVRQGDDWQLLLNGEKTGGFGLAAAHSLKFSPDSQRLAAIVQKGDQYALTVDGQTGESFESFSSTSPVFSPDSRRIAALARRDGKWQLLVDGITSGEFDAIAKGSPMFSPDSQRVAAWIQQDGKWRLFVDDVLGPEWDRFVARDNVQFSPDGLHYAYAALRGKQWFVVVDGTAWQQPFDDLGNGTLAVSPNGRYVAIWGKLHGAWSLIINEVPHGRYAGPLRGSRVVFDAPQTVRGLCLQGNRVVSLQAQIREPGVPPAIEVAAKESAPGGWPGIDFLPELPQRAREYDVPLEQAACIVFVHDNTPAKNAGLRAGDTILKVDGETITNNSLSEQLYSYNVGEEIELEIGRDGTRQVVKISAVRIHSDEEVVQDVIQAAGANVPYAQGFLGMMYLVGYSVPADGEKAEYWLKRAAEQGDVRAMDGLGELYDTGAGLPERLGADFEQRSPLPQDDTKAVEWYRRAAELGFPTAQIDLGNMYLLGRGVRRDLAEAARLYRVAAEQGSAGAQLNLALCYLHGMGVAKDTAKAHELLQQSASWGDEKAIDQLRELGIEIDTPPTTSGRPARAPERR